MLTFFLTSSYFSLFFCGPNTLLYYVIHTYIKKKHGQTTVFVLLDRSQFPTNKNKWK